MTAAFHLAASVSVLVLCMLAHCHDLLGDFNTCAFSYYNKVKTCCEKGLHINEKKV